MRDGWDPDRYLRYRELRNRPALELLNRVSSTSPALVVDLGCGTGRIARAMRDRWPDARVVGIDRSAKMLTAAAETGGDVQWLNSDIAEWTPDSPVDVLYSNAALQWLPDHQTLLPKLVSFLAPGGVLAVQMPLGWSEPSHALMRDTLESGGPGRSPLGPEDLRNRLSRRWVAEPIDYHDLLTPLAALLDIWTTRYLQVLQGPEPVFEWVKGTGLRPILDTLEEPELETFLTGYRKRLVEAYPRRSDGTTIYPFPRLFIVATAGT